MKQLAIRLTQQKTLGKSLVIPQAGEEAIESLREFHIIPNNSLGKISPPPAGGGTIRF